MAQTLFERIMAGEIPCHRVHADEATFAFLDIEPLAPGHTLLIPREPAPTLDALSPASGAALGRVLPRLCRAIQVATGCPAYNVLQNNGRAAHQAVPHVHFHIIPRPQGGGGLQLQWPAAPLDPKLGEALAEKIASALSGGAL